jgi:methyl-accepting chemotaxis protein
MRRLPALLCVGLAAPLAVLALSGCGGSSQSEAEKWADSVCSSIGDWRQELSSTTNDLTTKATNGTLNLTELRSGLNSALNDTKTLASDIRDSGPPNTEAGQEARQKLNDVTSTVEQEIEKARAQADSAASLPAAIAAVAPELTQSAANVTSQLQQISQLDPKGELGKAIDDTESCQDLRK